MKLVITEERPIQSYEDLQALRNQLQHSIENKSETIKLRVEKIKATTDIQDVYDEILEDFDLQHGLMNMVPMVLKYRNYILNSEAFSKIKKTVRKPKFIFLTTFAGIFSSVFYFKIRKKV